MINHSLLYLTTFYIIVSLFCYNHWRQLLLSTHLIYPSPILSVPVSMLMIINVISLNIIRILWTGMLSTMLIPLCAPWLNFLLLPAVPPLNLHQPTISFHLLLYLLMRPIFNHFVMVVSNCFTTNFSYIKLFSKMRNIWVLSLFPNVYVGNFLPTTMLDHLRYTWEITKLSSSFDLVSSCHNYAKLLSIGWSHSLVVLLTIFGVHTRVNSTSHGLSHHYFIFFIVTCGNLAYFLTPNFKNYLF